MTTTPYEPLGLEISESPIPVSEVGEQPPFASLERDLRSLMREVGESRYALEESRREHRDRTRSILMGLLEALDALDRVLESVAAKRDEITPPMRVWLSSFRTARLLLDRVLADEGMIRVNPAPTDHFDPHRHRVGGTVSDPQQSDGAILEVTLPGWLWKGTLLRKAAVIIVYNGDPLPGGDSPDR